MDICFCSHCGVEIGTSQLCPSCAEDQTVVCEHCGERIWEEDVHQDSTHTLCESCFENHYQTCVSCGRIIANNNAHYEDDDEDIPYCESCYYDRLDDCAIHPYSYRPSPIFYGEGARFFGVELEIDEGGKDACHAKSLLHAGNRGREHIYIKSDGSLDDGLEIVTHPMSPKYHQAGMPWKEVVEKALALGYTSHKAKTCGLHIHINRDSFGNTLEVQEDCISRVLFFVERFWAELLIFSRRSQQQVDRWAARYGIKDCPKDVLEHAKKAYAGRYACVNLTNRETIEFRIFRGTLRYGTLAATIQLVDEICDLALDYTDDELAVLSWPSFVAGIDPAKKPELVAYLKMRRLYINEPVYVEVDD